VTLGVHDLTVARSFYEALSWKGAQQLDREVCFFQAGSMVFGLWTALGDHGAPGIELAYNLRTPEEVETTLAEAQLAGATIVRPAAIAEWDAPQAHSLIRTDTYGRSSTILDGP